MYLVDERGKGGRTDDTEDLLRDLDADELASFPLSIFDARICTTDVSGCREEKRDGMFSCSDDVASWTVDDDDTLRCRSRYVNIVDTNTAHLMSA
jgi:hypothetical protein